MRNIRFWGEYRGVAGSKIANRNFLFALAETGINVYLKPAKKGGNAGLCPIEARRLALIERKSRSQVSDSGDTLIMNMTNPPRYGQKYRGLNLGWYIFETDRVPSDWLPFLQEMDGLITPTEFHRQQLRQAGYEKPVYILHEGINPAFFRPGVAPLLPRDKFSFLLVAVAHSRKKWRIIVTSFLEEFSTENVRLMLKLKPTRQDTLSNIEQYIITERQRTNSRAEIVLSCSWKLPARKLASLYASADCYVSVAPEGWGLPQMEAIACGIPAILLDWGGQTEWFTEEMGWKVPAAGMENPAEMEGNAGYDDKTLQWAVPNLKVLREQMRYALEHQAEAKKKGDTGSQIVREKYRWQNSVGEFLRTLPPVNRKL